MPEVLQACNGSVTGYAHELDKPYIEGTLPLIKMNPQRMAKALESLPETICREALRLCENPPKIKVDVALKDGEELPYCGGIRVIFTRGHTPGHILYLNQNKTLVAADALICVGGILHGPVQQTTLDMKIALDSLQKFMDYDIENVLCYHGGLVVPLSYHLFCHNEHPSIVKYLDKYLQAAYSIKK